tara:strand:- start:2898 stop:3107 length:210 start_codon:yes stop_codon:yes gene_type:complete
MENKVILLEEKIKHLEKTIIILEEKILKLENNELIKKNDELDFNNEIIYKSLPPFINRQIAFNPDDYMD